MQSYYKKSFNKIISEKIINKKKCTTRVLWLFDSYDALSKDNIHTFVNIYIEIVWIWDEVPQIYQNYLTSDVIQIFFIDYFAQLKVQKRFNYKGLISCDWTKVIVIEKLLMNIHIFNCN